MLVVYDPTTGEIIGHCSRVFDNGKWREATIEEIFPERDRSKLEALYLKDDPRYLIQGTEHWRRTTAKGQATVELRAATETVAVIVTATAPGYRPATLHLEFIPLAAGPSVVF